MIKEYKDFKLIENHPPKCFDSKGNEFEAFVYKRDEPLNYLMIDKDLLNQHQDKFIKQEIDNLINGRHNSL